jgi:hypothetical protein
MQLASKILPISSPTTFSSSSYVIDNKNGKTSIHFKTPLNKALANSSKIMKSNKRR